MNRATCVADASLLEYLQGGLAEAEARSIESHLEICSSCLERIQRLESNDSLHTALESASSSDFTAVAAACQQQSKLLIDQLTSRLLVEHANSTVAGNAQATPMHTATVIGPHSGQRSGSGNPFYFLSAPETPNELGRLTGYRILRLLGQGGMGMVFEAEDIRLKRRVALKVMKPEIAANDEHRVRFIREAQVAAAVEHDHICPIYQVGEDNGVPFIAMPFLQGEGLDEKLRREIMLPIAEVLRIGREVAEGLAAAHRRGLVHRDIKPGNIWLVADADAGTHDEPGDPKKGSSSFKNVKILDFGLARPNTDDLKLTQTGAIMGTPAYMSPEQARAEPLDARADLFSLGVVLYEMATGRRPFRGKDTMSILTSLAVDDPKEPNLVNAAIPAELSGLIIRLLAKSPEKRPSDGRAVSKELQAIANLLNPSTASISMASGNVPAASSAAASTASVANTPGPTSRASTTAVMPAATPSSGRRRFILFGALFAVVGLASLAFWRWPKERIDGGNPTENTYDSNSKTQAQSTDKDKTGSPGDPASGGPKTQPVEELRVKFFNINHFEKIKDEAKPQGVLGQETFGTHLGDQLTFDVEFNRPVYAYLVGFRPDGLMELVYPDSVNEPPPRSDRVRYPPNEKADLRYTLSDGAGLTVFAVAASDRPLPAFKSWADTSPEGVAKPGDSWGPFPVGNRTVLYHDGDRIEPLLPRGTIRGKDKEALGAAAPFAKVVQFLKDKTGAPFAAGIAFAVEK